MTVEELREALKDYPPDMEICVEDKNGYWCEPYIDLLKRKVMMGGAWRTIEQLFLRRN